MYNMHMGMRTHSPLPQGMDQERRKKLALESSLLNVSANKRELEQELTKLKQEVQQHSLTREKLQKREEDILFYEESLELIRKDMENLNAVIFAKNREHVLVNEELDLIRARGEELEGEKARLARTLEQVVEEVGGLLQSLRVGGYESEGDIVSQLRADCRQVSKAFSSMQADVAELLRINDEIRGENAQLLAQERERVVKLEYEKRLVEERLLDERRRKEHLYTEEKDSKVHALEVQLLKEQQESQRKLFHMSQMKTSQSSRITDLSAEKENSMQEQIFALVRRNKELEREKREAKQELERLRGSYKLVIDKYSRMNLEVESSNSGEYMAHLKSTRRLEEERKKLEIRIEELAFKNRALEDELGIYRGERG